MYRDQGQCVFFSIFTMLLNLNLVAMSSGVSPACRRPEEAVEDLLTQQKLRVVVCLNDVRDLGCVCRRVSAAAEGPGDDSSSHTRSAELCSPSGEG